MNLLMRQILIFIALAIPFPPTYAHEESSQNRASLFIRANSEAGKVVSKLHQALKSGDRKLVLDLISSDVLIYEGGGVERSASEYAAHHLQADINFASKMEAEIIEHHVRIFDDIAISSSRSKLKGKIKGKKIDIESMETIVLKKEKGSWKIINIHWS